MYIYTYVCSFSATASLREREFARARFVRAFEAGGPGPYTIVCYIVSV